MIYTKNRVAAICCMQQRRAENFFIVYTDNRVLTSMHAGIAILYICTENHVFAIVACSNVELRTSL